MTKLFLFILLSATAVQAGDAKDSLRDVMDFCNQFVIRDPDRGVHLDHHMDCHIYDRDDDWGAPWH